MYQQDSFFTLSVAGQVGLVCLSLILTLAMLVLTWFATRRHQMLLRMAIAGALFLTFEWVSPQVYYTYYLAILPGLPNQWVITSVPDPLAALHVLSFSGKADLSAHGRGLLGWAMCLTAILVWHPRAASRRTDASEQ